MAKEIFNPNNLPSNKEEYMTEIQVRELIAAALANYTGVVRFRNVTTTDVNISDFTNSQHTHSNAAGGGQLNLNNVSTTPLTVPNGGTGVNTLTGIVKASGASAFTAITPLSGTKVYWVSDTSGGAVTRKLTFTDGVLTAEV
jgi:hypothetical protein